MKLIIDIPEKVVTAIQNGEDYRYDIHTAIAQGIPYEERPHGKWLTNYESQFFNPGRSCSLCNKTVEFSENFCPNCGADMRGNNG